MNRFIIVRHGGSTGNEDPAFYAYNDSALCLTTNGIRQALATAGILAQLEPRWGKPGNFALEVFVSEYNRAQQTARITLDQMNLLSIRPQIAALLNERDYGLVYDKRMDEEASNAGQGGESALQAKRRVVGFLNEISHLLDRADVLAFSHFGTIRAIVANLLDLTDTEMMTLEVPNGRAFAFQRVFLPDGSYRFEKADLPDHILVKEAKFITEPPTVLPPPAVLTSAALRK
ncbi:histidine phosphatase family protein [Mesorhizobium sp. M4B.F.Ca.ET.017.02.2.1]|uniref:histidine phosphatase family protein n=1 Tax=Mesorhizobium sp. M4B.F.Ca.ET.017.02.2.1 TaxID=2496649 RepID=UPI000FCB4319|nr:histidine phosphatase family protein [Mesorhizobium sp. M4B.F.Ca.ET.017.02.2.1]RVD31781.1 histidine phosphatase family protein [Mesorhizobium sp. M4B.F.Ca.ET.017.02.2.1]